MDSGVAPAGRKPGNWKNRISASPVIKVVGLLSLTRAYNIALLATAQYFSCIFFFTEKAPDFSCVTDTHFFVLVVCTWMTVAGGYIINYFYDKNKDFVNHPHKSSIDGIVSQTMTLRIYLALNFAAVALSLYVSLRSVAFFSGYAFVLWFYSHKLKKMPLVSNVAQAVCAVIPLFAVFFYRKLVDVEVLLPHGFFIFFTLLSLNLLNDMNNQKGDAVFGYRTLPLVLGPRKAKAAAILSMAAAVVCSAVVYSFEKGNAFAYYFVFAGIALLSCIAAVSIGRGNRKYYLAYTMIKALILAGLLWIPLRVWVL